MIPIKVELDGKITELLVHKGKKLLDEIKEHNIKINDACEGSMACGTCHVLVDNETFKKLTPATDQEDDLLQFVPGLKDNSRLACGILVEDSLTNALIKIPKINRNLLSEHDL
ncbi:2Fe-2S_ferredoxin 1 [Hexamita inflata]|uniref:2Fe-2S ferredoxin 1 n=1 Tax=Hexamita inflata TaxID=28002 RepID=A0AA86QWM2_9EUKA|nr:2Fe-2S ferredoxin 1 [Hexamita inflata]CAI9940370.1 2Fe-2S ferredoxin 1 [Hexamita inflata]CAI9957648.1 2Fe-2S ferredoxin 1 [Hexamita inflata]CAI9963701.1 2Fe-2S ferredoxin 1 [Hexamita inflata]CAI9964567.1 2Fe-2S ferredoxin 1 [Hexamita inflata]